MRALIYFIFKKLPVNEMRVIKEEFHNSQYLCYDSYFFHLA